MNDQDIAQERTVTVTDNQLLDLWLSGGVSAVGTLLRSSGLCPEHVEMLSHASIERTANALRTDPLLREAHLESIHAIVRGENPPTEWIRAGAR